jgi:hypothetical protein
MIKHTPRSHKRRTPYTERGISRIPCVKCGSPSHHQWRICCTNAYTAVCRPCDETINAIIAKWAFGPDEANKLLAKYRQQFPE